MNTTRLVTFLLLTLFAAGWIAGCENTIEPFDNTHGFYSLYGSLDLKERDNFIRVKDLNIPLRENSNEQLDVKVTLENLNSGRSQVLEDSIRKVEGVFTHNFHSTMNIQPGTRYRVTVVDSAGNRVRAQTKTPRFADENHFPKVPQCDERFELSYHKVDDVQALSVDAGIQFRGRVYWVDLPVAEGDSTDEAQFRFTLKELIDTAIYKHGYNAWCHHLSDDSLYVRYDHLSSDFFEQLASDTVTIPGGTGRFGAMYHEGYRLEIDTSNVCFPYCGDLNIDPDGCPPSCGQAF